MEQAERSHVCRKTNTRGNHWYLTVYGQPFDSDESSVLLCYADVVMFSLCMEMLYQNRPDPLQHMATNILSPFVAGYPSTHIGFSGVCRWVAHYSRGICALLPCI